MNDISDYWLLFVIYDCDYGKEMADNKIHYRGVRTEESINAFRSELLTQNWKNRVCMKKILITYEN